MLKYSNIIQFILRQQQNSGFEKVRLGRKYLVSSHGNSPIVGNLIEKWTQIFQKNSISEPKESVENIIMHCLNIKKFPELYKCNKLCLSQTEVDRINTLCNRRMKHEPIQYIIGEWDFRYLTLKMSPPVFIPRPETEMLVDLILDEIDRKQCKHILELCCGSGAISLSLLDECAHLRITAIDKSEFACNLTRFNAKRYNYLERIDIIRYNLDENNPKLPAEIAENFDIIVSNPPYIRSDLIPNLQPEVVKYEDLDALNGGNVDGLDLIKSIIKISSCKLNVGGKLFLEVDPAQPALLKCWINRNYPEVFHLNSVYKDFYGKDRFVEIIKCGIKSK